MDKFKPALHCVLAVGNLLSVTPCLQSHSFRLGVEADENRCIIPSTSILNVLVSLVALSKFEQARF